jgi:ubiquinone/menaquinone biosynthesis C-methylase UbiE
VQGEEYRQASHDTWEAMAPGWERWRAQLEEDAAPLREWMIHALAPKEGDTVLELSAGAGDTGFEVAPLLGRDGRLISSDFSPEMVDVARRRGTGLGLENADYRVIDAEHIDLEDDSVDGVLCRWGYMLMADPAAALAETRRVLRTGGRLVLSVFSAPEHNPWASVVGRILVARGKMEPPAPGAPGVFSMTSEERTRELLEGAGFEHIELSELPLRFFHRDVADYMSWATTTAGALALVLRTLSDDERQEVEREVEEAFAPFAGERGYEVPALPLNAVAS